MNRPTNVAAVLRKTCAFAVLAALATISLAGCSSKPHYGSATRALFVQACDPAKEGGRRAAVCDCAYDQLQQRYSYDEYSSIDAALHTDPNRKLPDDILRIIAGCALNADFAGSGSRSSSSSS